MIPSFLYCVNLRFYFATSFLLWLFLDLSLSCPCLMSWIKSFIVKWGALYVLGFSISQLALFIESASFTSSSWLLFKSELHLMLLIEPMWCSTIWILICVWPNFYLFISVVKYSNLEGGHKFFVSPTVWLAPWGS